MRLLLLLCALCVSVVIPAQAGAVRLAAKQVGQASSLSVKAAKKTPHIAGHAAKAVARAGYKLIW